jgi:hypothetical protein
MADHTTGQVSVQAVERPLNLVPVGLKEAALDSPTFRATAVHFADQVEIIEKWLDGYVRAASKLVSEVASLESLVNSFLAQSAPPSTVSEAVLDHDYTLLALTRYGEGAREFWQSTLQGMKKYDTTVVDPIKAFLSTDLRQFKDARRAMEGNQKAFDAVIARYLGQNKSKEPSSLREDAFQVHEARRAYLKSAMDFCMLAPQLRTTLDKMIVKVFSEQYREMRNSREANSAMFAKSSAEMERVRGWSREMENSERAFKRELVTARRQIEDSAEQLWRPSRYGCSKCNERASDSQTTAEQSGQAGVAVHEDVDRKANSNDLVTTMVLCEERHLRLAHPRSSLRWRGREREDWRATLQRPPCFSRRTPVLFRGQDQGYHHHPPGRNPG